MKSRGRLTFLITEQRRVFRPSPASVSCQRLWAPRCQSGPPPPDSLTVRAMMSCCSRGVFGGVFGGLFGGVFGVLVVEGAGAG